MARKQKTIHYIYKTTNLITKKYYIGMHLTNNLEDGYMGSGKRLRYSIRKYGIDNHVREILEYFESRELLIEAEKKAITPEMISDINCLNIVDGGGGFTSNYAKICVAKSNEKQKLLRETDPKWVEKVSENKSIAHKNSYVKGRKKIIPNRKGKTHSDESKKLMSDVKKGKYYGKNNPSYGTCWVMKGSENKKINKEIIESYLTDGWIRGRKI